MKILIVEDEQRIINFLTQGLSEEGHTVEAVRDGQSALDWVAQTDYDVILLDVMLPGLTGFEVCRILRERGVSVPVLMLTARDEIDDRVTGLDAGADDYLPKPFAFKELLARLRALTRRNATAPPPTVPQLTYADLTLDPISRSVHRQQHLIELTVKEYAMLELFLRNPERVLTRTIILESLWGYDYYGASNVVDVYVRRLRRKLESTGGLPLIQTVRGVGYKLSLEA